MTFVVFDLAIFDQVVGFYVSIICPSLFFVHPVLRLEDNNYCIAYFNSKVVCVVIAHSICVICGFTNPVLRHLCPNKHFGWANPLAPWK